MADPIFLTTDRRGRKLSYRLYVNQLMPERMYRLNFIEPDPDVRVAYLDRSGGPIVFPEVMISKARKAWLNDHIRDGWHLAIMRNGDTIYYDEPYLQFNSDRDWVIYKMYWG